MGLNLMLHDRQENRRHWTAATHTSEEKGRKKSEGEFTGGNKAETETEMSEAESESEAQAYKRGGKERCKSIKGCLEADMCLAMQGLEDAGM